MLSATMAGERRHPDAETRIGLPRDLRATLVGPFVDAEWDDVFAPCAAAHVSLDASARKEIANWSGGLPVLASKATSRSWLTRRARGRRCPSSQHAIIGSTRIARLPASLGDHQRRLGPHLSR
jgi:hypothetical protein